MAALLEVRHLTLELPGRPEPRTVLRDLSLTLEAGEIVGLTGESGAGKTLTALSILRLLPAPVRIAAGQILFEGRDLLTLGREEMRRVRGRAIGIVFQEPISALHPMMTVGAQIAEVLTGNPPQRRAAVAAWLDRVGIAEPARRALSYPHELSGGERQRMVLALALAGQPRLLIADEPTSALDAVLRRQILDLLLALRRDLGLAMLLITHDLDAVAPACDRLVALAQSKPAPARAAPRAPMVRVPTGEPSQPLLSARGLVKTRASRALLDKVDLQMAAGECVAVVGRSGSGKTTLARCLLRLTDFSAGEVRFRGDNLATLPERELRRRRRHFQIVFQDPFASLDPRQRVGAAIAEPLLVHRLATSSSAAARARQLLDRVGLPGGVDRRFPHEFSGGQRQRIAIARALASAPELLIADEPVSSLDASVREQILDLLSELRREMGLALLLIAHDLVLVERLADRVVVLHAGRVVEEGPAEAIFSRPQHDETRRLLAAAAGARPDLV